MFKFIENMFKKQKVVPGMIVSKNWRGKLVPMTSGKQIPVGMITQISTDKKTATIQISGSYTYYTNNNIFIKEKL